MSISTWLENSKVQFSVVAIDSKEYLVCFSNVGSHQIIFVEKIVTGKRVFPSEEQRIQSGQDLDVIVKELVEQF